MEHPRVDLEHIRDLMKLMDQYNFDEIEVRDEGKRLHLTRSSGKQLGPQAAMVMPTVVAAGAVVPAAVEGAAAEGPGTDVKVITSPMVGTFYRAPAPEAEPFVEVGERVTPDTTLCVIEAMKVMNEIESEIDAEVLEVLVTNGQPVEYGEVLFRLRPA